MLRCRSISNELPDRNQEPDFLERVRTGVKKLAFDFVCCFTVSRTRPDALGRERNLLSKLPLQRPGHFKSRKLGRVQGANRYDLNGKMIPVASMVPQKNSRKSAILRRWLTASLNNELPSDTLEMPFQLPSCGDLH
jgi:hypothetical protein